MRGNFSCGPIILMNRNPAKPSNKFLVLLSLLVWAWSAQAVGADADIVLGAGKQGSSYWHAGERLQSVASQMGLPISKVASDGSLENLDNLLRDDSPVNLVFAQADALQLHLNRYPSDRRKIEILEKIGQQCVFVVTALRSGLDDVEDIKDSGDVRLGIDSDSSGVSLSFDYINSRVSQFENVQIVYDEFSTLAQHLGDASGEVDAILLLSAPRDLAAHFQYVLDNPHRYRLLDFEDDLLTRPLPDGRRIYREARLALPGATRPVRTLCARGLLLANRKKMSPRQRNRLTDLVSYYWMRVYSTSTARN